MNNIVFDLYGTLVDIHTDEYSKNFWKKFVKYLRKNGIHYNYKEAQAEYLSLCALHTRNLQESHPDTLVEINISDVFYDMCRKKRTNIARSQSDSIGRKFRELSTDYIRLYDGTIELLTKLKTHNKNIWLLSNAQELFTMPELEKLGLLKYFDGIAISSVAGVKKPDAGFAEYLFTQHGLDASDCIMIGNEYASDVMVAKNSGMGYVYILSNLTPKWEWQKYAHEGVRGLKQAERVIFDMEYGSSV